MQSKKDIDISKIKGHRLILVGNEHYNPLGLIRSIGELGLPVTAIIIRNESAIASKSRYIKELHFVNDLKEAIQLLLDKYGNEPCRPFVFTCDDTATDFFNEKYNLLNDRFYFFNSGDSKKINRYMNKLQQVELAKSVGMHVLWTREVDIGEIPNDIVYPVITKAIDSRESGWKRLSFICHNEEELKEAYKRINVGKVVLQQFVHKKNELGIDGFAINRGKQVLDTIAYNYKYVRDGTFSHFINIFALKDKQLLKLIYKYIEELNYEGIFDIEFLEDQNGKMFFCEINLRNSGWSYASSTVGMPLPVLWAVATLEGEIDHSLQCEIPIGYSAMEEVDYLRCRIKEHKGVFGYISEFVRADCHFIYNKYDMKPFWACIQSILSRKIKKEKK